MTDDELLYWIEKLSELRTFGHISNGDYLFLLRLVVEQ